MGLVHLDVKFIGQYYGCLKFFLYLTCVYVVVHVDLQICCLLCFLYSYRTHHVLSATVARGWDDGRYRHAPGAHGFPSGVCLCAHVSHVLFMAICLVPILLTTPFVATIVCVAVMSTS